MRFATLSLLALFSFAALAQEPVVITGGLRVTQRDFVGIVREVAVLDVAGSDQKIKLSCVDVDHEPQPGGNLLMQIGTDVSEFFGRRTQKFYLDPAQSANCIATMDALAKATPAAPVNVTFGQFSDWLPIFHYEAK